MSAARKTSARLLASHRPLWRVTCRNPFVAGLRDGSLPLGVFNRWLVQDRYFVDGLFPAMARILAGAPARDREVLLEGLRTILGHLEWFDRTLAARGLDPGAAMHPVCRAYVDFNLSLGFERYPIGVVALWAQFRAYRDALAWARPAAPKFREIVRNWSSPEYLRFLRRLARAVDAALAEASASEARRAEEAFVQVAKYELAFWVMTLEEKGRV